MLNKIKIGLVIAIVLAPMSAIAAEKYRGKWNGTDSSTLTITSTAPLAVRYCYLKQCTNHNPSGNLENMSFGFPPRNNFPGATISIKKTGKNYMGRYQVKGAPKVSTITFRKSMF